MTIRMSLIYTLSSDALTAYITPNSYLDDLFTELPTTTNFIFLSGEFYLTKILFVTKNNLKFTSLSGVAKDVHIIQKNSNADGIAIKNCAGIAISNLSIHNTFLGKIALTLAGVKNTIVNNCYIYGCDNTFSVYYAGPTSFTEGISTLNGFFNGVLDNKNIFTKNVVYSKWAGDAVSFSLQSKGSFSNNIVRGGKVAVYMCKDCVVRSNIIYDSTSHGIYLSFPSTNVKIVNNKIYECRNSGIKLSNQTEHGSFAPIPYNIVVSNNKIYDTKFYAIEVNDGINITISENNFVSTDIYGIYSLRTNNLQITSNKISYFSIGVWLETTNNVVAEYNNFYAVYPEIPINVIKITNACDNVSFNNNSIKGILQRSIISVSSDSTNIVDADNYLTKFYTYEEEYQIMKL